jgi:hypothetical protein
MRERRQSCCSTHSALARPPLSCGRAPGARPTQLRRGVGEAAVNSHPKMSVDRHRKMSVGRAGSGRLGLVVGACAEGVEAAFEPEAVAVDASTSASWSRRSRIAAASASSPKVCAHSATVLLLVTIVEPRVAAVDDLKDAVGVGAIQGRVARFVDDQQLGALELRPWRPGALPPGATELDGRRRRGR